MPEHSLSRDVPTESLPTMTMTLSRKRVLLISVASVAVICLIAVGLVRAGVLGGHGASTAASASP